METQTPHLDLALRDDVRLLGRLLGRVIASDLGEAAVDRIETIRSLAKSARSAAKGSRAADWTRLSDYLSAIPTGEIPGVARAFNQFLNLANIAEQHHQRRRFDVERSQAEGWTDQLRRLVHNADFMPILAAAKVELVLTAHPTEVLRRTMIQKYDAIAAALARHDVAAASEQSAIEAELERLIAEAWFTDEIRHERPAPQDEAKWGFAVIENSLWRAVPDFHRDLDAVLEAEGLEPLPVDAAPVRFATWMGGDRDGNPNVTADVTREVLMLARWMAADLYLRDVEQLSASLSMSRASPELIAAAGNTDEPYRAVLKLLRDRLRRTRDWAERLDAAPPGQTNGVITHRADLLQPLELCYDSLVACGMERIARGPLLDTLRRIAVFGITLVDLDIRQSADRHVSALDAITRELGIVHGERSYARWTEAERQAFLLDELASRRPLVPRSFVPEPAVQEVLNTCAVVGRQNAAGIAQYVISMATAPSDVLAVILLLKEHGLERPLPVVPLFETLSDLEGAARTIDALLAIPWYRAYTGEVQQVMIGYSDSAKDAGQLAAAWAQYGAQEQLAEVARRHRVRLALFHGRGGTVGRGGGPSRAAILSQPPGSVAGMLRVTEQGEMIRFKLGLPALAADTIGRYLSATVEATLSPPAAPRAEWRAAMDKMSKLALAAYRGVVRDDPHFVALFRSLTPERELGILALGSRPARRAATEDVASLRAIPWVFAWTQVRLMAPAWLGTEAALEAYAGDADERLLRAMLEWPFFSMQLDTLEMVLAKVDVVLVRYYASRLTDRPQQAAVAALCRRLERLIALVLAMRGGALLDRDPALRASLAVRNTYLDPLHLLQAELLARYRRETAPHDAVGQSLKVTMAGIASGLRNTG